MLKFMFVLVVVANGVFATKCKPKECPKGEEWDKCPESRCSPLTCCQVGFPVDCSSPKDDCNAQCVCSDGKVRDDDGNCILPKKCPACGGDPNAVAVDCKKLCPDGTPCIALCVTNTCECKKGYVLDKDGKKCVEECSTIPSCGANEKYTTCANGGCGKWNCTQIGEPDLCIDPIECEPGCVCVKGYLRAKNGSCIPENQCYIDVCKKANEIYDLCPAYCPSRTCGFDDRLALCAKPLKVGDPGCKPPICRCQDGFYRDHKGECVTLDQCPLCSKPNEIYHPCPPGCPPRRCDVDDRLIKCAAPPKLGDPKCKPSCICADGYARNGKGYCVPRDECPKCNKPHEVYDKCPDTCKPQTCNSIGKVYFCPKQKKDECKICEGQCVCKHGYYRNSIGNCISKKQCLKCTGPHEYYSCGGACDNVCATLSTQNQTNCPIINVKCNEMCYCEEGYARDKNNVCIPIEKCPKEDDC